MNKKAYITKYALTKGIIEADQNFSDVGRYLVYKPSDDHFGLWLADKDWSPDRALAVARAEEMRIAKIASLEKQIQKLKKMRFV